MNNIQGKRVDEFNADTMAVPGNFIWYGPEFPEKLPERLSFVCPCGCGAIGGVAVGGDSSKHPIWQWNNDLNKPTVEPSIRFIGGCEWHGYLTDGVFITC